MDYHVSYGTDNGNKEGSDVDMHYGGTGEPEVISNLYMEGRLVQ